MARFFYRDEAGLVVGPLTAQELRDEAATGQLKPFMEIRKDDGAWRPAHLFAGLKFSEPAAVEVSNTVEDPVPAPVPEKPRSESPTVSPFKLLLVLVMLACTLTSIVMFYGWDSSWNPVRVWTTLIASYLVLAWWTPNWLRLAKPLRTSSWFLAVIPAVLLTWGYMAFGVTTIEWERDDLKRTDWEWGSRVYWRRLFDLNDFWTAEGPISPSGRLHGEWTQQPLLKASRKVWYWYGDEITEGEWHLRNR